MYGKAEFVKCARCNMCIPVKGIESCSVSDCAHVLKGIGFQPAPIDLVNHPPHYRAGEIYETIRVIEAWELNYNLGCCIKYVSRCGRKNPDNHVQDLEKARWYLTREIDNLRKASRSDNSDNPQSSKDEV